MLQVSSTLCRSIYCCRISCPLSPPCGSRPPRRTVGGRQRSTAAGAGAARPNVSKALGAKSDQQVAAARCNQLLRNNTFLEPAHWMQEPYCCPHTRQLSFSRAAFTCTCCGVPGSMLLLRSTKKPHVNGKLQQSTQRPLAAHIPQRQHSSYHTALSAPPAPPQSRPTTRRKRHNVYCC